jgi:hypothetical protein
MRRGRSIKFSGIAVLLFAVIIIVIVTVGVSPFILRGVSGSSAEWNRLSDIAQTYGGAAAVLSTIALIGVAASLVLQSRGNVVSREQTIRTMHTELLKMAMTDPLYAQAWGPFFASDNFDDAREHMYVNLIISSWKSRWETGGSVEQDLRSSMYTLFSGIAGQRFWSVAREVRMRAPATRREARFNQILDEEYRRAVASPAMPPVPSGRSTRRPNGPSLSAERAGSQKRATQWPLISSLIVGILAVYLEWRRRQRVFTRRLL